MGPAAPTILGDVLVPRHGQVVDAVDVAPRETIREVVVFDLLVERVVARLGRGVAAPDEAGGLDLVLLPDLCVGGRGVGGVCARGGGVGERALIRAF